MARPQSEECEAILAELREQKKSGSPGMTSADIARRLQLSREAASRYLSRLVDRGTVTVADKKRVPGVDRPVYVYRVVEVNVCPEGTIFESLNRMIAARRRLLEEG